ncbi:MAG: hypothetical protein K6T35_11410, partial [Meiothermus silvanus]|nr:hypothetical protein [Allomeiothermus silvanus]
AQGERDPMAVIEPQGTPLTSDAGVGWRLLRGQEGSVSHAPAFLGRSSAAVEAPAAVTVVPRRRFSWRRLRGTVA